MDARKAQKKALIFKTPTLFKRLTDWQCLAHISTGGFMLLWGFISVLHNKVIYFWEILVEVSPSLRDQQLCPWQHDRTCHYFILSCSWMSPAYYVQMCFSLVLGLWPFLAPLLLSLKHTHNSCTTQTGPRLLPQKMRSLLWQLTKFWTVFSLINNCKCFIFSLFPTKMIYSARRDKCTQLTKSSFNQHFLIANTLSTHSSHILPWMLFVCSGNGRAGIG